MKAGRIIWVCKVCYAENELLYCQRCGRHYVQTASSDDAGRLALLELEEREKNEKD